MGLQRAAALKGAPSTPLRSVGLHYVHGWGMVETFKIESITFFLTSGVSIQCYRVLVTWVMPWWLVAWTGPFGRTVKHRNNFKLKTCWTFSSLARPPIGQPSTAVWLSIGSSCLPCRWSGQMMGLEGGRYHRLWSLRLAFLNCISKYTS